jgi:hypothetical protein
MRFLARLLLGIGLLLLAARAAADALPEAFTPATDSDELTTVDLSDPLASTSRSFLDLDQAAVFKFGDASGTNVMDTRIWIRQKGVDLMCESRDPVKGLAAYDMAVHETGNPVDEPRDVDAIRKLLNPIEPQRMQFVSAGEQLPRTFCFRTREGQFGILEISERIENGFRIRFRVLHDLPPPIALALIVDELRKTQIRVEANVDKKRIEELQVRRDMLNELYGISHSERIAKLASMRTQSVLLKYQLQGLQKTLPPDAPQVVVLKRKCDAMQERVEAEFDKYKMPKLHGMTPVVLLPIRSPASQPATP